MAMSDEDLQLVFCADSKSCYMYKRKCAVGVIASAARRAKDKVLTARRELEQVALKLVPER